MRHTDFAPLAGPYRRRKKRPLIVRALMRLVGLCIDLARWLLQPRP